MHYTQHENLYIIRLEPKEELLTTLTQFCEQKNITGGWLAGLGGASEVELAAYSLETKTYSIKKFTGGIFEVTNFTGNISKDKIHIHMTIGDHEFKAHAGHLNKAIADPTIEIQLQVFPDLMRQPDDYSGLAMLALDNTFEPN